MKHYDLIVVGGGFAGTAAALAAARDGLSVLILEQSNALSGAASVALIQPFMPYHTMIDGKPCELSRGIFREIREHMWKIEEEFNGTRTPHIFNGEYLKQTLNDMVREYGVSVLYHATVYETRTQDGVTESVTCTVMGQNLTFTADVWIDATGDANLAYMAGYKTRLGRESDSLCQPMTLCFRLGNVDFDRAWDPVLGKENQEKYRAFQKAGKIKNPREDILTFRMIEDRVMHMNTTRVVRLNPTDPEDLTRAEFEARDQIFELFRFLRNEAAGFEHCTLLSSAVHIGIRESRMIDGLYTLTGDDLTACCRFSDAIAYGNYDIDIHNPEGSGTSHYFFPAGQYYEIPYRTLIPKGSRNMLVAGRCISVTHEAQASIRIMPIVCCIGEGAGVAAALYKNGGCTSVADIPDTALREALTKYGAIGFMEN